MSYKELVRAARELVFRNTGMVLPEKELIEYVKDLSNSAPSESQSVVDNEVQKKQICDCVMSFGCENQKGTECRGFEDY